MSNNKATEADYKKVVDQIQQFTITGPTSTGTFGTIGHLSIYPQYTVAPTEYSRPGHYHNPNYTEHSDCFQATRGLTEEITQSDPYYLPGPSGPPPNNPNPPQDNTSKQDNKWKQDNTFIPNFKRSCTYSDRIHIAQEVNHSKLCRNVEPHPDQLIGVRVIREIAHEIFSITEEEFGTFLNQDPGLIFILYKVHKVLGTNQENYIVCTTFSPVLTHASPAWKLYSFSNELKKKFSYRQNLHAEGSIYFRITKVEIPNINEYPAYILHHKGKDVSRSEILSKIGNVRTYDSDDSGEDNYVVED
jgi:hypothetical protein